MTLAEARKLPNGTLVRFSNKKGLMAARDGATARIKHDLVYILADPNCSPWLYVEWIRDGLDCGQNDGGYDPKWFVFISRPQCNCDLKRLMTRGCGCGGA